MASYFLNVNNILLKKIKGTLKQHNVTKKEFNKIISFIQIYDVLF